MNNETFNSVRKFVIEKSFVNDEEITRETRLQDDLGIYGDDAVELIIAFGKQFNVNVSNFMAGDYFAAEGGLRLLAQLKDVIGMKTKNGQKVLTVGHLEKAILAGRLDEEVINS